MVRAILVSVSIGVNMGIYNTEGHGMNYDFMGAVEMIATVDNMSKQPMDIAIELGCGDGEMTSLLAMSHLFKEIHAIGDGVHPKFYHNTSHWDNIIKSFGDDDLVLEDESIDFIYVHGSKNVKEILDKYSTKLKKGAMIGGNGYLLNNEKVMVDIENVLGEPDFMFCDSSWLKVIE
jgi:precorrin-6B methylase 2